MFAILSLIATFQGEVRITFESPGRPLKEVLAKLEPMVGRKLFSSAELGEQPVIIIAQDRPWGEIKKDLAWAFRASWKDDTLARSDADRKAHQEEVRQESLVAIKASLDHIKRISANWGKWTDEDLKLTLKSDVEYTSPRRIPTQAIYEAMLKMGAERISGIPVGTYYTYPAQAGEKEIPADLLPIIRQGLADILRSQQMTEYKEPPPTQAALVFQEFGEVSLLFASANGGVAGSGNWSPSFSSTFNAQTGTEEEIPLSPRAQNVFELSKSPVNRKAVLPLPETIAAVQDPLQTDPVELFISEILIGFAKGRKLDLVATPNWLWGSRLGARAKMPLTDRQTAEFIRQGAMESVYSETSLTIRSTPSLPLVRKRSDLAALSSRMYASKTSLELAESLMPLAAWDPVQVGEALAPHRLLNRSLEFPFVFLDLRPLIRDPYRPFREVITMPADVKRNISEYVRRNPRGLGIERPRSTAASGEGGSGTGLYVDEWSLDTLPTRAFPNGIPNSAELEWIPRGEHEELGWNETLHVSATESPLKGRRVGPSGYAAWAKEGGSDAPKFFWTVGLAGGTIILRFPGGIRLSSTVIARAIHPDEKPKPVSELPDSYRKMVEEAMKWNHGKGQPPPR